MSPPSEPEMKGGLFNPDVNVLKFNDSKNKPQFDIKDLYISYQIKDQRSYNYIIGSITLSEPIILKDELEIVNKRIILKTNKNGNIVTKIEQNNVPYAIGGYTDVFIDDIGNVYCLLMPDKDHVQVIKYELTLER